MYSEALLTGKDLPLSEALAMGGETTVIGLSIVFGVLVILMIVLMLFKVIFYKDPKKQTEKVKEAKQIGMKNVQDGAEAVYTTDKNHNEPYEPDEIPEDELVAILTAAVASSLNTSTYNLRIKSYRRVDGRQNAWNRAGLTETINNRY